MGLEAVTAAKDTGSADTEPMAVAAEVQVVQRVAAVEMAVRAVRAARVAAAVAMAVAEEGKEEAAHRCHNIRCCKIGPQGACTRTSSSDPCHSGKHKSPQEAERRKVSLHSGSRRSLKACPMKGAASLAMTSMTCHNG